MKPHLRYLRYVLVHKLAVFRAGWAIREQVQLSLPRWVWRLLVHDLSKLSRAEWTPYVEMFYGEKVGDVKAKKAAFDHAWLHHIHANPHHWQHWVLREDSGRQFVLVPPSPYVDEMLADWLGAGPKASLDMTFAEKVAQTILWYVNNAKNMQLREAVANRIELSLAQLALEYGVRGGAEEIEAYRQTRVKVTL